MNLQEFLNKYNCDPATDLIYSGRFGSIYKARYPDTNSEFFLRTMPLINSQDSPRLLSEVKFVSNLPACSGIVSYRDFSTIHDAGADWDYAVMDAYPLGNLKQLLENWKLNEQERASLRRSILDTVEFLRANKVVIGQFNPETIFIEEKNGVLTAKFIDLSAQAPGETEFETSLNEYLPAGDDNNSDSKELLATETETSERPRHNKVLLLIGVILTWAAVITLICLLHIRNNTKAPIDAAPDIESVTYPADQTTP